MRPPSTYDLVVAVILSSAAELWSYAIIETAAAEGLDLNRAATDGALRRLEEKGLVAHHTETGGRRRKKYHLTQEGRAWTNQTLNTLDRLAG